MEEREELDVLGVGGVVAQFRERGRVAKCAASNLRLAHRSKVTIAPATAVSLTPTGSPVLLVQGAGTDHLRTCSSSSDTSGDAFSVSVCAPVCSTHVKLYVYRITSTSIISWVHVLG